MIRIVGDVHGMVDKYVDLVKDCDYSLQVGDMGFDYCVLAKLDELRHRFIGGNHDNYDFYNWERHSLGDWGMANLGGFEFFFIRGAFSIDWKYRIRQEEVYGIKSWWNEEQLSLDQLNAAVDDYKLMKPEVMVTHTCPQQIARLIGNPGALKAFGFDPDTFCTNTQLALQECFEYHKPKLHIYGHFHQTRVDKVEGTTFVCLDELDYLDIDCNTVIMSNGHSFTV